MAIRTTHLDALRILFILRAGCKAISPPTAGDALVFKGELRLQAFDFWMRYPDYLAAELLDLFEKTGEAHYIRTARSIIGSEEPDLRHVPMTRYLFSAFERLDDALAILTSRELVRITGLKGANGQVLETDFVLTQSGVNTCSDALNHAPVLQWFADRADLVAHVAGDAGGTALKDRQYLRWSYAQTKLGRVIPRITDEVRDRLVELDPKPH